jgi:uncharacterized protein
MQPEVEFEWSSVKTATNLKKHGVSFLEAQTAFNDVNAYIQEDAAHSEEEPRETLMGFSDKNHLLVVSFTQRGPNRIRNINARRATRRELRIYEERSRF